MDVFAQSPDEIEQDVVRGFSRSIAELEWLLLLLSILYLVVPGTQVANQDLAIFLVVAFGVFTLAFRYLNFLTPSRRWKIALETWVMIAFLTALIYATGDPQGPLLNLFLLIVIASALTLGRLATVLEVALIAGCYLFLGYDQLGSAAFSGAYITRLIAELAPLLLTAYLTTMLAADILNAQARIQALADTDELTGLLNMRAFARLLEREHARSQRYGRPYGVLMADVDGLKMINDTFGHEEGNRLLVHVANVLRSSVRASDVVARFGGDEYVVLLMETEAKAANEIVNRIQSTLDATPLVVNKQIIEPSVSIGVGVCPDDGAESEAILRAADKAMYTMKNGHGGERRKTRLSALRAAEK